MKTLIALFLFAASVQAADFVWLGGKIRDIEELKKMSRIELLTNGIDRIAGKVAQSVNGGALIIIGENSTRDEFTTVFVEHSGTVADGDYFICYATESGLFEYTSVLGAKKTVRKFYPALKPTPDQLKRHEFALTLDRRAAEDRAEKERKELEKERKAAETEVREFAIKQAKRLAEQENEAREKAKREHELATSLRFAADSKITAVWKKRASDGEADAQYEMGLRCLVGKGIEKSGTEALRYFSLAASQGHKNAAERLASQTNSATNVQPAQPAK